MKMLQLITYLLGRLSEAVNIGMNDAADEDLSQEAATALWNGKNGFKSSCQLQAV